MNSRFKFHQFKIKSNDTTDIKLLTFQGFEVVIDSSNDYPLAKRDSIMIRPGHTVSEKEFFSQPKSQCTFF